MAALLARRTRPTSKALVPMGRATPSVASTSVSTYTTTPFGQPMLAEWRAPEAVKLAYLSNVYVFACARAIAQDVASQPFRVGADPTKPTDYNTTHRLASLLGPAPGGPASNITARQLIEWTVVQRLITGRWCWERVNDPVLGVASLWPLPASHLEAVPSKRPQTWFDYFVFGVGEDRRKLMPDSVVYGWKPSQTDWRQPESALQAARLDISVAVMQDRYDYSFLKNDARPASIIVHEAFDEEAAKIRWRRQFLAEHRGPANAGKPLFAQARPGAAGVGEAIKVIPLGMNQRDAEFIQRYESKIKAILVAFGVPMTRLGDASARTFSNAGEESSGYWNVTVKEVASELAAVINMELAPIWGSDVGWFDFTAVDKMLSVPRFNPYQGAALAKAGVILRDEVRAEMGLPPIDSLDPVEAAELNVAWDMTLQGAPPVPATLSAPRSIDGLDVPSTRSIQAPEGPDPVQMAYDARRAEYRRVAAGVKTLERQWERKVQRLLDAQQRSVLERLNGKRGRQATRAAAPKVEALFNVEHWEGETADMSQDLYESIMALSGAAAAAKLGVDFDLASPYAQTFIETRANQLAGQITATTYDGIKAELSEGVEAGESIDDLADRIRDLFEQTYAHRAETVARTEVISGYNGSTQAVGEEYGDLVDGMEWIATMDDKTRESHLEADGQVVAVDETFDVGDAQLAYPGDPDGPAEETVNCRCTIALIPAKSRAVTQVTLASAFEAAVMVARGMPVDEVMSALTSA